MIRIANGQGFWGDWLEAPVRLVEQGPIDYLALDYLAEITMSILQKQKQADPNLGYARDFPPLMARIAQPHPRARHQGDRQCRRRQSGRPARAKWCALAPGLKVAVVLGDDVFPRLDEFLAKGYEMRDMDTGEPLSPVRDRILSANAYIGAFPLAEALATGADVVIAGRSTDTALALAPMVHRFGWSADDCDKLAAGTIAGHIIECGAQCTGGNCQVDWQSIPDMANIGYPIVEAEPDGTFAVTKHAGRRRPRQRPTRVKEQLLYELGDPKNYITPDCVADFTSIQLADDGPDRVRVTGIRGGPRPPTLKLSHQLRQRLEGHRHAGLFVAAGARKGARGRPHRARAARSASGLRFDEIYTEFFGVNACHGPAAPPNPDPPEVQLRIGVRGQDRKAVDRFTRELIPLVLNGPPGATGFGEGRPPVREIVAYWSALIPREEIATRVEVVE